MRERLNEGLKRLGLSVEMGTIELYDVFDGISAGFGKYNPARYLFDLLSLLCRYLTPAGCLLIIGMGLYLAFALLADVVATMWTEFEAIVGFMKGVFGMGTSSSKLQGDYKGGRVFRDAATAANPSIGLNMLATAAGAVFPAAVMTAITNFITTAQNGGTASTVASAASTVEAAASDISSTLTSVTNALSDRSRMQDAATNQVLGMKGKLLANHIIRSAVLAGANPTRMKALMVANAKGASAFVQSDMRDMRDASKRVQPFDNELEAAV
jgi:hypothetical protein